MLSNRSSETDEKRFSEKLEKLLLDVTTKAIRIM